MYWGPGSIFSTGRQVWIGGISRLGWMGWGPLGVGSVCNIAISQRFSWFPRFKMMYRCQNLYSGSFPGQDWYYPHFILVVIPSITGVLQVPKPPNPGRAPPGRSGDPGDVDGTPTAWWFGTGFLIFFPIQLGITIQWLGGSDLELPRVSQPHTR